MKQQLDIVTRHFPERGRAIEALASRDEEFRSICMDLAEAESEAVRWRNSRALLREERIAEFEMLVHELAGEIEALLNAHAIIPLNSRRQKPPR